MVALGFSAFFGFIVIALVIYSFGLDLSYTTFIYCQKYWYENLERLEKCYHLILVTSFYMIITLSVGLMSLLIK